ncbi:hypothetical protein Tco_0985047, partial [Tanacetum coccineum]
FVRGFAAIAYGLVFCFDHGLLFVTAIRDEPGITIYGSDLLILSAYAPSMPPLLSLPLSIACDDSDRLSQLLPTLTYDDDDVIASGAVAFVCLQFWDYDKLLDRGGYNRPISWRGSTMS